MALLIRRRGGIFSLTGVAKLAVVSLLSYIGLAFVDTIWAVYMEELLHNVVYVSFLSAFFTIIAFCSYFLLIPTIEKYNKSKLFSTALVLMGISYLLLALNKNVYFFILVAGIINILISLKVMVFGIIIKDKSSRKNLARNEGVVWSFFNLSWVIGPLIAGLLSEEYGIPIIFVLASVFLFIAYGIFKVFHIQDANVKKKIDNKLSKNFWGYFKNKARVDAYILGGGVNFWLILIFLYMPLLIKLESGKNSYIGYFLFFNTLPLILTEFKMASIAGKVGFKKMFKLGFLILASVSLVAFFVDNLFGIMALMTLGSFGLAMIEPTTEAYFFDILKNKKEELRYYGPYNTTIEASYFFAKVLSGIFLIFLPLKALFLFFSFVMFLYFLYCFQIKEVKEKLRK